MSGRSLVPALYTLFRSWGGSRVRAAWDAVVLGYRIWLDRRAA